MRPVSRQLFTFTGKATPAISYERCSAADLSLSEKWLSDAIFERPELVIEPCKAAGLTEDDWHPWQREFKVPKVGSIDVLLVSSEGRVAIVETKLATNPEARRKVLAQAFDYLTHLPDVFREAMPELPEDDDEPVANESDVRASVANGNVLVIIASDDIDDRAAKLSAGFLSGQQLKLWDLALVDVALYRPTDGRAELVVVPTLRNAVRAEPRHVIQVNVSGPVASSTVSVEDYRADEAESARQKWDAERFFTRLHSGPAAPEVRRLANQLRDVATGNAELSLSWGTGQEGSMTFKRNNGGLVEVYGSGVLGFRPRKFARALGKIAADKYRAALAKLAPDAMVNPVHPRVKAENAGKIAPSVMKLIQAALADADDEAPIDVTSREQS